MNNRLKTKIKAMLALVLVAALTFGVGGGIKKASAQTYTVADAALHNMAGDCWMIIDGKVYNVTSFISQHPGGSAIIPFCGQDASQAFAGQPMHQYSNATGLLPTYYIGDLVIEPTPTPTPKPTIAPTPTPAPTPCDFGQDNSESGK